MSRPGPRLVLVPAARRALVAACSFCAWRSAQDSDLARLSAAVAAIGAKERLPERVADLAAEALVFLAGARDAAARQRLSQALDDYWRVMPGRPVPGVPARRWWLDRNGDDAA